jgi:hypothetical protein
VAAGAVFAVLGLGGYLFVSSSYVYATPHGERFVKGYACTPEALAVYGAKCPDLGADELRGAEYEAARLWTLQSIGFIRMALVALWIATFAGLAVVLAGLYARFTLQPRRSRSSRR